MTLFKTLDCLQESLTASEPQGVYLRDFYCHSDCYFYIVLNSYFKYFCKLCTYFFKVQ